MSSHLDDSTRCLMWRRMREEKLMLSCLRLTYVSLTIFSGPREKKSPGQGLSFLWLCYDEMLDMRDSHTRRRSEAELEAKRACVCVYNTWNHETQQTRVSRHMRAGHERRSRMKARSIDRRRRRLVVERLVSLSSSSASLLRLSSTCICT